MLDRYVHCRRAVMVFGEVLADCNPLGDIVKWLKLKDATRGNIAISKLLLQRKYWRHEKASDSR